MGSTPTSSTNKHHKVIAFQASEADRGLVQSFVRLNWLWLTDWLMAVSMRSGPGPRVIDPFQFVTTALIG